VTRATLIGRTVLVTRPEAESASLIRLLEERGATALLAAAVRTIDSPAQELDPVVEDLVAGRYAWLILTSRAGVDAVFRRAAELKQDAETLPARIAAVGDGTARALAGWSVRADLVPPTFTTEALGEAMPEGEGRVLLARADIAPEGLEAALAAKGWTPERVTAYRTELVETMPVPAHEALTNGRVDAVTFTSASTVRGFIRMASGLAKDVRSGPSRPAVVCIGPVTAREAEAAGMVVDAVAEPHTIEGVVAALERFLGRPSE
jgi:uroporphyrinogen-III synthase